MKKRTKLFSLILSLILIMVSVPMSVYSEEVSQAENSEQITENGFEDVSLETDFGDVQENLEIVTQVDISVENPTEFHEIAAAASSTVQLISGIPNGIYAFESNVGSNMFMKSAKSSPQDGDNMTLWQQNNPTTMPHIRGVPIATFMVTKKESSGTYIIRLRANESLTLAISGTSVITKSIPENDSDVAIEDTFYISSYAGGYTIRPYSSNSYIASKADSSGLTVMASINNRTIWFPRGYRAYIDDGVYALLNRENTTSWIGTAENDFLGTKLARTYERSTCPAADFQRNCLFKITQIGTSGEYVIRLMTNNLLTWSVRTDGKVFSRPISYDDSQITDTSQKYYIVFDKNSFMLLPCSKPKTALVKEDSEALDEFGETVSYISTVERVNATNSARWLMYKYIGPDRCGADIILPDEIESIGAIVGNTYTISHTVWYTKEDMFDFSVSAIDSSFNDVSFEYDSDNYTATMTVHNLGEISYYVLSKRMVDGVPMMSISADVSFYVIPQEGTYYLQNSHSNLYANVINHSTDNGAIIHQLGFSTDSRFKWEIEHVEDSGGYVLLKSQLSNMYMGVDLDSSSTQTRIRQYEDVGDNTLWRFETLDDGSVKIICKATESSGKVLAVPNVLPGTGEWLTQSSYTEDENCNDEWYMEMIDYDVFLLGIINSGHDHSSSLIKIIDDLKQCGYSGFNRIVTNRISASSVLDKMSQSKIFVSRSHGGAQEAYSCIQLFNSNEDLWLHSFDIYDFDSHTVVTDLSNCELLVFVGCSTGYNERSLPYAAVEAGAECAIGFKENITCDSANVWTVKFFELYAQGYTIEGAAIIAASQCSDSRLGNMEIVP